MRWRGSGQEFRGTVGTDDLEALLMLTLRRQPQVVQDTGQVQHPLVVVTAGDHAPPTSEQTAAVGNERGRTAGHRRPACPPDRLIEVRSVAAYS
ncbi:hypothetical protein [Amycolatopsis jiangsuensis]|uniref:Uncharacterized protein n=1 Tax=Amycolatopsis jiangsuensis TaxID=1181879 RepID=A0A840J0T7_9PSEU|nr:hypothetical protein [Amycolatopsis jiangsuensis]MBB4686804.1 hypothetical protein [Amycolatopsis jiangsuensis]